MASELNGNHVLSKMFHRSVRYSFFGFFTVMLNTAVDGVIIGHFLGTAAMSAFGQIVPLYSFINVLVYDKNPAGNIGLRIISNIMSEMQYMCIMDCNILLIHIR